MNAAVFREATAGDLERLVWLRNHYREAHVWAAKEGKTRQTIQDWLDAADHRRGGIWVVELEGLVAGYMALAFGFSIDCGGSFGLIDELFLHPDYREECERRLVAHAMDVCRAQGIGVLRMVGAGGARLGFHDEAHLMRLRVR